jgi:hypothetical protein
MEAEASFINSNPVDIYAHLPQDYINGLLYNDLCSATGLVYPSFKIQSSCTTYGGSASFSVGELDPVFASFNPKVKVGDMTIEVSSLVGNSLPVLAGTYDASLLFGDCIQTLSQITGTCPSSPIAMPTTTPSATTSSAISLVTSLLTFLSPFILLEIITNNTYE